MRAADLLDSKTSTARATCKKMGSHLNSDILVNISVWYSIVVDQRHVSD